VRRVAHGSNDDSLEAHKLFEFLRDKTHDGGHVAQHSSLCRLDAEDGGPGTRSRSLKGGTEGPRVVIQRHKRPSIRTHVEIPGFVIFSIWSWGAKNGRKCDRSLGFSGFLSCNHHHSSDLLAW
jgi:hypothetical protein